MSALLIDALMDRERQRDHLIQTLRDELAYLKAPPAVTITHHGASDPHPYMVRLRVDWQGYRHQSLADRRLWEQHPEARDYTIRHSLESCVRAVAESHLDTLVVTEETYDAGYNRPSYTRNRR